MYSKLPPVLLVEVTFNETTVVYVFVGDFIKIKFGISGGHLVRPVGCNLTKC